MDRMQLKTEFLCNLALNVHLPLTDVGGTPHGDRLVARITGGTFSGPKLKGHIHDGGGDWLLTGTDGVSKIDVRMTLETDDGALLYTTYHGFRHGPEAVMADLLKGKNVDPNLYYFRTSPRFETASKKYMWLNSILTVAVGRRDPAGPVYDVYEIL